MALPTKRILTLEAQAAIAASDSLPPSTPTDLAVQLRTLGARIRSNVAQGYTTPTSARAFTKASSTGSIFRSANDTLRDIYSDFEGSRHLSVSQSKRAHPDAEPADEISARGEQASMDVDDHENDDAVAPLNPTGEVSIRPMKPLRQPRNSMSRTTSLPASSNIFLKEQTTPVLPTHNPAPEEQEEEDWTIPTVSSIDHKFEPMLL